MEQNMWAEMSLVEKIFTFIQLAVMFEVAGFFIVFFIQLFPDFFLIANARQEEEYYEYYEDEYQYLDSSVQQMLANNSFQFDVTKLPNDIKYDTMYNGFENKVIAYIDYEEGISIEYSLSESNQVVSQKSFKLEKEALQEKTKKDMNSLLGITVLIMTFSLIAIVAFIYGIVTFLIYLYERVS